MRKAMRPKELTKILVRSGFVLIRQKGSHAHFRHPDGRFATIPMHNRDLKRSTLQSILKQADIDRNEP